MPSTTMPRAVGAASASVLLLQKATTKRQQQALRDAFKVGNKIYNSVYSVECSINCQKADKNGDGKLSYEEYWNVVKRSGVP